MDNISINELYVMLIEPSPTQQRIIREQLSSLGMKSIECFSTGLEAIDMMKQQQPDLVVSSMYLDDMTGADLVIQMRENPELEEIAFMLISSETNFHALDPIRQAGSIAILPKPFAKRELSIALNATLDYLNKVEAHLDSHDLENLNVLVVDDSLMARKHICRVLNRMGIEKLTQAENGEEAAELISNDYFDLVVTDYNMPEMDGAQLTKHIRESSSQRSVPILMVTSENDTNRLAAVQQAGVSAICDKPFEPSNVRELIETMLSVA